MYGAVSAIFFLMASIGFVGYIITDSQRAINTAFLFMLVSILSCLTALLDLKK